MSNMNPPISPATVPTIEVSMTFDSVAELLEFFGERKVENLVIKTTNDVEAPVEPKQKPAKKQGTNICRKCDEVLEVGTNWYPSYEKNRNRICTDCVRGYHKNRRKEGISVSEKPNPECRGCGDALTDANWYPSYQTVGNKICRTCNNAYNRRQRQVKKEDEAEKPKRGRNLAANAQRHRKAKEEPKAETQAQPETKEAKTRPVGDLFKGAYEYMSLLISDDDKAAESEILELIETSEPEMEMAREVVLKLMRAAVSHAPTDFQIAAGKKGGRDESVLLRLSTASLPSLDFLRAY
jgi:hypothetical protein